MTTTTEQLEGNRSFNKEVKKAIINYVVSTIIASIAALVIFYFHTSSNITKLFEVSTSTIENVKNLSQTVNDLTKYVNTIKSEADRVKSVPESHEKQIEILNTRMDHIEQKTDKIYEILIDMNAKRK